MLPLKLAAAWLKDGKPAESPMSAHVNVNLTVFLRTSSIAVKQRR